MNLPVRGWGVWALVLAALLSLAAPQVAEAAAARKQAAVEQKKVRPAPSRGAAQRLTPPRRVAKRPEAAQPASRARPQPKVRSAARLAAPRASVATLASAAADPAGADAPDVPTVKSNAAMVLDMQTNEVLLDKNARAVLPIASLTKLMTALVVTEAELDLSEPITITQDDVDTLKGSGSRLAVGTTLSRGELLHLALMSSENRAAHALGRTYPGGLERFVAAMNAKAQLLGMSSTHFVEPTGLSPSNRSSAKDLAVLVKAAYDKPLIRELSTTAAREVDTGRKTLHYRNTNALVGNPQWDIGLQKTGYIAEAGRCLVMQATVAGRQLVMVFLDSAGKLTRVADAERVRRWVESRR